MRFVEKSRTNSGFRVITPFLYPIKKTKRAETPVSARLKSE